MTLRRNNPDIDYDVLEQAIANNLQRIEQHTAAGATPRAEPSTAPQHPVASLADLYALDDVDFIRAAYQEFLKREPDPDGQQHYLEMLHSGTAKNLICAHLRYSEAGRQHPQRFALTSERWLLRLSRLPVIGRALNLLHSLAGIHKLKRGLLAQQQQLYRQQQEHQRLANIIDKDLYQDLNSLEYGLHQQRLESVAQLQRQLADTQLLLEKELRTLRLQQAANDARLKTLANPLSGTGNDAIALEPEFYHRFEEHFRGPRDVVKARVRYYLPQVHQALDGALSQLPCIDIGCGRGEWLEVIAEAGFNGVGVDLDSTNVHHCQALGLQVEQGDALGWLKARDNNSLAMISAFHVVEHLSFDDFNQLLLEAQRVLAPGGLIILETPNPENLNVGANNFYIDPTHRRPIPPVAMEFLAKHRGFAQVTIHRLHPVEQPDDEASKAALAALPPAIQHGLFGPQDYSLVACKPAAPSTTGDEVAQ